MSQNKTESKCLVSDVAKKRRKTFVLWALLLVTFVSTCCGGPRTLEGQTRQARNSTRNRNQEPLQVGQLAPTFQAQSVAGDQVFDLKQHRQQKPVVLIFGSWT